MLRWYLSIFVIGVDPGKKLKKTIQHVVKLFNTFSNYSTRFNKLFSIELSFSTVHNYSTPHSTHYSTPHSTLYSTLNKTVNSDPNGRKPRLNRIYRNFLGPVRTDTLIYNEILYNDRIDVVYPNTPGCRTNGRTIGFSQLDALGEALGVQTFEARKQNKK
jgi:hypothetical protein